MALPRRVLSSLLLACSPLGCVLGDEQAPGCRPGHPEDCGPGWFCRAGLCLRATTSTSPPNDASRETAPDAFQQAPLPDSTSPDASPDPAETGP